MEKAVAAAHTFLKKNPADPYLTKNMDYYKTLVDVEEYLIDHEEQPYEVRIARRRRRSYSPVDTLVFSFQHSTCLFFMNASLCDVQSVFLKSVTLYNSGDFSGSARNMEQAIAQYLEVYGLCLAGCEGSYEILEVKDFYPTLAGESRGPIAALQMRRRRRLYSSIS